MTMRIRVMALAASLIIVVMAPAHAATIGDSALEAIVALQGEVMLLVELDAIAEPVPSELTEVHDEWIEYMQGLDRRELVDWLIDRDDAGRDALDALVQAGVAVSPATADALDLIPDSVIERIEAGDAVALDANRYVDALRHLELYDGASGRDSESASTPTESAPGPTAPATVAQAAPTTMSASALSTVGSDEAPASVTRRSLPWVIGLVAIVLAAVMAQLRRRQPARESQDFERLLEAGRRMTRALDRDEIARIARVEAMALARADHGAFVRVTGAGMELVCDSDDIFESRRLDDGALQRVADTGQSINLITHDEPAITALPAALLAVPVIGNGRVTGIIVLIRPEQAPFTGVEQSIVSKLAPMVGSAIAATQQHDVLAELSLTDGLTGLPNRRSLDQDLEKEVSGLSRGSMLAVGMVDVDHFKHFNDTNGHAAGDLALEAVANAIAENLRSGDQAYRYGGEEFSLVLHVRSLSEAADIGERLRHTVEIAQVEGAERQPSGRLTVSIGVAVVDGGSARNALSLADAALYAAKSGGRNRVELVDRRHPQPVTAEISDASLEA